MCVISAVSVHAFGVVSLHSQWPKRVAQQFKAAFPQHLSDYSGLLLHCLSNVHQ